MLLVVVLKNTKANWDNTYRSSQQVSLGFIHENNNTDRARQRSAWLSSDRSQVAVLWKYLPYKTSRFAYPVWLIKCPYRRCLGLWFFGALCTVRCTISVQVQRWIYNSYLYM